ncbi:PREDICTED: B9 domain-containing protein 2 [Papilio polytes]|uniref:B9 domain-containing protein 2 n=1 Tax=Papilio polytes TaxID=76194 RepID=UPI000675D223|nr:PREDICTED: B9 domain-containing protein 2 [Papilio polytes]
MAELHLLGDIQGVTNFEDCSSLFCRFSFQAGPNWTLIAGCSEGQTTSGKPNHDNYVFWSHPIDVHYATKGISGWPKINFQVSCLDSLGRSWIVGYGCCSIPTAPGNYAVKVPCWSPAPTTITDRLRQYFLGGSHQITQTDVISLGVDRYKLTTQSKGNIELNIDIIFRNFTQFGVEYK